MSIGLESSDPRFNVFYGQVSWVTCGVAWDRVSFEFLC